MPLNLTQMAVGTIVDRVSEWGEDGKERPLQDVPRGIIVRVDGDSEQEQVGNIYVCYGPKTEIKFRNGQSMKQDKTVTVNGVKVLCKITKAAELIEVFPADHPAAKTSWRRLFKIAVNVGLISQNRQAKGGRHRRHVDALQLTPVPKEGLVTDDEQQGEIEGLPEEEA